MFFVYICRSKCVMIKVRCSWISAICSTFIRCTVRVNTGTTDLVLVIGYQRNIYKSMLTCFYLSVILYFIHTLIIRLLFPMEPLLNFLKIFFKKYSCTWWNWSTCKEKITRFPYWFIPNICPLVFSSGNYLVPLWESIFNSTSLCNYSHRVHVIYQNLGTGIKFWE